MKKYTLNVHYDAVISVEVIAENEEQAKELALDKAEEISLSDADVVGSDVCVTDVQNLVPIMNTSNNHNPKLVEKINKAYYTKRNQFGDMIKFLMERDKEECEEYNVHSDVHSYLMHVADDTDLECIINYTKV